jgi:hypothetical protein
MNPIVPQSAPVAVVEIALMSNGNISTNFRSNGTGRDTFNMMLKRAEQDMLPKFLEAEARARDGVEVAPPGFRLEPGKN